MEHGGLEIVAFAVLIAGSSLLRQRVPFALCAFAAVALMGLLIYELPSSLLNGVVFRADLAWGAYLAAAGVPAVG
jgi:hypothetical protein